MYMFILRKDEIIIKCMPSWKAPGNDMIHSFWWKKLSSLHSCLPRQLQEILNGSIPQWLVSKRLDHLNSESEE